MDKIDNDIIKSNEIAHIFLRDFNKEFEINGKTIGEFIQILCGTVAIFIRKSVDIMRTTKASDGNAIDMCMDLMNIIKHYLETMEETGE